VFEREREVIRLHGCLREGVVRFRQVRIFADQFLQHCRRAGRRRFIGDLRQQREEAGRRIDERSVEQRAQVVRGDVDLI
jgi:hypothetical protein